MAVSFVNLTLASFICSFVRLFFRLFVRSFVRAVSTGSTILAKFWDLRRASSSSYRFIKRVSPTEWHHLQL